MPRMFDNVMVQAGDPALEVVTLNKHATDEQPEGVRAIYVGTGGTLTLRTISGTADVVFKNLPNGAILPVRPKYIRATGSTAADLIGFL